MLGLVHYSDDSDTDQPSAQHQQTTRSQTEPVIPLQDQPLDQSAKHLEPIAKQPNPSTAQQRKTLPGIRRNRPSPSAPSPEAGPSRTSDTTAQAPPQPAGADAVERWEDAFDAEFRGMSDEQVFRRVSRPPDMPGVEEWGIPPPTAERPSTALQAKVSNFLKLKIEQDRHINTTLLSSTAFANPHIYSKLVEFVDIDERGSAFPGGGWITRRNLESRIPEWGPHALAAQQKAQETALLASQASGKRKNIDFTSSRKESSSSRRKEYSSSLPGNGEAAGTGSSRRPRDAQEGRRGDVRSLDGGRRNGERDGKRREKERRWD
ncbi:hypothetical protein NCC49_001570 [Naganishia albida]|nr:hypothetical protein NCC49_001570 [Naganishia albida]